MIRRDVLYPVAMPTLIAAPSIVEAAGNKPKLIREFVGALTLTAPR
jgi:hypothetical protein